MQVPRDPREGLLPGGCGRSSLFVGRPPPRLVRGAGFLVWDQAGRELIDLHNNFTVSLHGHAHPAITEAAVAAARAGACFGLPTTSELALADLLVERVPWGEQVRFTSSGTEATMTAVRLARAATARSRIVMLSPAYHGTSDPVLPAAGATRGIPAGTLADVATVGPNDIEALRAALNSSHGPVAALILDLAPALGGCVPLDDSYVQMAFEAGRAAGALVIVDEVISFRCDYEGLALGRFRLEPDLLVLGKVIGGGFPVGAVLGRASPLRVLDPSLPGSLLHGGTFTANPVTMSAGRVALELFDRAAVAELNALGERALHRFRAVAAAWGWDVTGTASVFRIAPTAPDDGSARHALWWRAFAHGLLLSPSGVICLSTPMTWSTIDEAAHRLEAAFEDMEMN